MGVVAGSIMGPLVVRLRGPGGLYNLGNAIGFGGGLIAALSNPRSATLDLASTTSVVMSYVAGSPTAVALTLATGIFFWSGEEYHRAWANGFPPDERRTRTGDLSSAVGAMVLALGLFLLGDPVLAATAGLLHAAGKLGSALNLKAVLGASGLSMRASDLCRVVVVLSRIPALGIACLNLWVNMLPGGTSEGLVLAATLLICCTIWATADLMLLTDGRALLRRRVAVAVHCPCAADQPFARPSYLSCR